MRRRRRRQEAERSGGIGWPAGVGAPGQGHRAGGNGDDGAPRAVFPGRSHSSVQGRLSVGRTTLPERGAAHLCSQPP